MSLECCGPPAAENYLLLNVHITVDQMSVHLIFGQDWYEQTGIIAAGLLRALPNL